MENFNKNVDRNDQQSILENSSATLTFQHESDFCNIQSEEEYYLTDSDDYNFKRITDIDITVDETDFSDSSDEEESVNSLIADKTLIDDNETEKTVDSNKMEANETLTSESSLLLLSNDILDDVDIIESSDNIETFITFSQKSNILFDDEKCSELEEDADLFASQEEQWLLENSTFNEKNEKIFTHQDSLQNILMQYYKVKESNMVKVDNFQESVFHGFSKNEFSCKIKLCPTKRERDIEKYFDKCEKEIHTFQNKCMQQSKITEDNNSDEECVQHFENKNPVPVREIVKNIEENKVGNFSNSSSEEDFLGFDCKSEVDCKMNCVSKQKSTKKVSKIKRSNEAYLKRRAKEFIFKEPNPKKPKVVVENVFSLFDSSI